MPPSASATSNYNADMARAMMVDVGPSPRETFYRAIWALILCGCASFLLLSVLTYNPFDHTGDTAGIGAIQNVLGRPGAEISNLFMQILGWGSFLFAILLLHAGLRAIFTKKNRRTTRMEFWQRAGLVLGVTLFGSAMLSGFPIPQDWPMATGLGGLIGDGIFLNSKGVLDHINWPLSGALIAFICFCLFSFFLARFVGIVGKDFLDIWDALGLVWAIIRIGFDKLINLFRRLIIRLAGENKPQEYTPKDLIRDIPDTAHPQHAQPRTPAVQPAPVSQVSSPRTPPKPKSKKPEFHFPEGAGFILPGLDLLKAPPPRMAVADEAALGRTAQDLHRVMGDYGIKGEMGSVRPGPVVTLFEFEPAPGVKSQRVINLADDIARNMSAQSARIAVVPGRNAMGIELPNRRRETVWLQSMLASPTYQQSEANLPLILGEDIGGTPFIADLAKMPHLLVAGTTGSGKSVAVNAMILSLMYKLPPEQCKFIMIDPKMLELSVYDGSPHLLAPVVTEPKKAVVALKWTVREMEDRYRKMSKMGVRNMAGYNEKVLDAKAKGEMMTRTIMTGYDKESGDPMFETEELNFEPMPYIVVIIDEMADLMMVAGKDIEGAVQRLAQMARAAGIHMIMATQRPSVDVITGTIKANFPTRISFRVGSKIDSRTILGEQGAEQLLGNGDMLFMGTGRPRRLHGPFVSDAEVEQIAAFVKAQGSPSYLEDITREPEETDLGSNTGEGEGSNSLFDQAVAIVARDRKASTSYVQRKLSIGYNRAANLIERMEAEGMIGPSGAGGKREIFLPEQGGI